MKSIILTFIFLLTTLIPASAVKKFEANPLCVAVALTEQVDTAALAKMCQFYGYQRQASDTEGYTIYTHPNGSQIQYTFTAIDGRLYPTVKVKSGLSKKAKEDILQNLRFQKTGNHYERRSQDHLTLCNKGPQNLVILSCHPKAEKPDIK